MSETKVAVVHELKTWPVFFEEVYEGNKTFEFRKNDRNFQVGDMLLLREYHPVLQEYTGRFLYVIITYMLSGVMGLSENDVILAIKPLHAYG